MNSVVSYPERGPFGNSSYRGNCSGHVIKDLLTHYTHPHKPVLMVDPMQGGGTSRDVCNYLNKHGRKIEYVGLDLRDGFNITQSEIRDHITRLADFIFLHPAYWNMIPYSGNVWGSTPQLDDLSHSPTYTDYLSKLQIALSNAYRALRPGAYYSLLIGDLRKNRHYYHISSDIRQLAPGELCDVIIKQQHNCTSDKTTYTNSNLIRIAHEYILTFRKPEHNPTSSPLYTTLAVSTRLQSLADTNWKSLTHSALHQLGGSASLNEICAHIKRTASDTTTSLNWPTRIKESLSRSAKPADQDALPSKAA